MASAPLGDQPAEAKEVSVMGVLVINTCDRLTPPRRHELRGLIGDFVERRPSVAGMTLYFEAQRLVNSGICHDEVVKRLVKFLSHCREITKPLWQHDIVVLYSTSRVPAYELMLKAIFDAVALKKGSDIKVIYFGAGLAESQQHQQPYVHHRKRRS